MAAPKIGSLTAARRRTITLPESELEVTIRVLSKLDTIDIWREPGAKVRASEGEEGRLRAYEHFLRRSIELAVVTPRMAAFGLPGSEPDALHIRDLPDDDYDVLVSEIAAFALGGARREKFQDAEGGRPPDAGHAGEAVREAPARDRESA